MDGFSSTISSWSSGIRRAYTIKLLICFPGLLLVHLVILKHNLVLHESYVEQYALDTDFKDVYATLSHANQVEELDYHVHDNSCIILASCVFHRKKESTS
jgi:hypothetical protein